MQQTSKRLLSLLLASSFTALAACGGSSSDSDGSSGGGSGETGSFNLNVTDAPIDSASHVFVEFSGVSLQPAEGETLEFEFEEAKRIDLLALQGSASDSLLTDEEVPAGEYEWIRLHVNAENDGVTDSYVELLTGDQLELYVPSGAQTGLKLVSGFTVNAGQSADFTIDFDLRKSIVLPGGGVIGGAILKPALRLVDNTASGSITGSLTSELITEQCDDPANEVGAVYVYSGADATVTDVSDSENDPITTALVSDEDADGTYTYEAGFMAEGDYTVAYTCDAYDDEPATEDELEFTGAANVTVEADAEVEQNFTLQSET